MQKYSDCSTYYCDRDSVVNDKDVNKFRKRYGVVGSSYSCYYNMAALQRGDDYEDDGQEHALLQLTYGLASYVNAWFWPSVATLGGILLMVFGTMGVLKTRSQHRLLLSNPYEKKQMISAL